VSDDWVIRGWTWSIKERSVGPGSGVITKNIGGGARSPIFFDQEYAIASAATHSSDATRACPFILHIYTVFEGEGRNFYIIILIILR
jgi:hypothetical protein